MDGPGKTVVVVDFLSTIINNEEPQPVDDAFLDEHLFSISTNVPWFAYVANYLVTRKLQGHMTSKENKRIVQQSSRFSWINGYLFYTGLDLAIRRCVREDEIYPILRTYHDGPYGGNFANK